MNRQLVDKIQMKKSIQSAYLCCNSYLDEPSLLFVTRVFRLLNKPLHFLRNNKVYGSATM
jgi:hypothetical protein